MTPTNAAASDSLRPAADAPRAPLEIPVNAPGMALGRSLSRGQDSVAVDLPIRPTGPTLAQRTMLLISNPLRLLILPPQPGGLPVRIENPSGEAFFGTLRLHDAPTVKTIVNLPPGKTEATVLLPLPPTVGDVRVVAELFDDARNLVLATPPTRLQEQSDKATK